MPRSRLKGTYSHNGLLKKGCLLVCMCMHVCTCVMDVDIRQVTSEKPMNVDPLQKDPSD